ncbi:MAG: GNAT family N-acetyltransferase [Alphaproteobacteria bacterium]
MSWLLKKNSAPNSQTLPDLILTGKKVYLRPPRRSDWKEWGDIRRKNQVRLKPFEPSWPPNCLSADFFRRRLARQTRDWNEDRSYSFLICKSADASLIGGININNVIRGAAQFASLGYWIDAEHEGQGYMKESILLAVHYCFQSLDLHRVHAACIPGNDRSQNLLLSCGFKKEGYAEKYLKIDGKWQDHILYGICKERFSFSPS